MTTIDQAIARMKNREESITHQIVILQARLEEVRERRFEMETLASNEAKRTA